MIDNWMRTIWETLWSWNSSLIEGTAFMPLFTVSLCVILCAAAATFPPPNFRPPITSTSPRKDLGEGLSPKKGSPLGPNFSVKKIILVPPWPKYLLLKKSGPPIELMTNCTIKIMLSSLQLWLECLRLWLECLQLWLDGLQLWLDVYNCD